MITFFKLGADFLCLVTSMLHYFQSPLFPFVDAFSYLVIFILVFFCSFFFYCFIHLLLLFFFSHLKFYLFFSSHFTSQFFSCNRGEIRNLGKPVALCKQYYDGGADEVVFLNITSFRQGKKNSSRWCTVRFIANLFSLIIMSWCHAVYH